MNQNSDVSKILEKVILEVSDVRKSIEEFKKSIKNKSKRKNDNNIYKEVIGSLIKSNLELHAKISELIVILNGLSKDIKSLLDIFKEAALAYMETEPKVKEHNFSKKIEELENYNKRLSEIIEKLIKEIEELKKEKDRKDEKIQRHIPLTPPPIPPPKR
ncbi:MAG: hypothetical protein QW038_00230 [Nanopusillaceae archaeon]